MENGDGRRFLELMNATSEYYGKLPPSSIVVRMYFNGLKDYTYKQVEASISNHIKNAETGCYMVKVADIVRGIQGGKLTADQIIGAARLANTPMGVLARIWIGSHDINHCENMFYLKHRAEECMQMMPVWIHKASTGDYSEHELSMMLKFKVDPCGPFYTGIGPPESDGSRTDRMPLSSRVEFLNKTIPTKGK